MNILGSHHSLSYAPVKQWWLKPFNFMCKCQDLNIEQQYNAGVRLFDIRLKYNSKNDTWHSGHGYIRYNVCLEDIFYYLNIQGDAMVRITLEYNKTPKDIYTITDKFREYCRYIISRYNNILFFGFKRKYDCRSLYQEPPYIPSYYEAISSMTGTWIDDWCPRIYAKLFNKNNIEQGTSKDILMIDFIGKYY